MRLLLLFLILSAGAVLPFVFLKRPWALRLWQKVRFLFIVYAVIVLVSAIVALVFRWDDIYG